MLSVLLTASFAASAIQAGTTPAAAQASTLMVDDDGQATADDCEASGFAYITIQTAVDTAEQGDVVFVCPGRYD